MPIQRPPYAPRPKVSHVEIYWKTVTYRTVAMYLLMVFAVVLAILYLIFPETFSGAIARISEAVSGGNASSAVLTAKQAKFVNLDGRVQVKKVNSVQWVTADYRMALDKGDLIQTGGDGAARITFADGTTYTVQSDTLVTVEENSIGRDSETRVAMHITSGAVDLATGTWDSPKSKAEVSFSNAVASVQQNSRAAVRSDSDTKESEITVSAGTAQLSTTDGRQHVDIGRWERVTVPSAGGAVVKSNVLAPPDLAQPLNLQPLIVPDPKKAPAIGRPFGVAGRLVAGAEADGFVIGEIYNPELAERAARDVVTADGVGDASSVGRDVDHAHGAELHEIGRLEAGRERSGAA